VWTGDRIDDLAANTERSFEQLRRDLREFRDENREEHSAMREEYRAEHLSLRADFSAMRSDLSAWQRQITQIGWAMAGTAHRCRDRTCDRRPRLNSGSAERR